MRATVSNVVIKTSKSVAESTTTSQLKQTVASEKTTFIVSAFEKVLVSEKNRQNRKIVFKKSTTSTPSPSSTIVTTTIKVPTVTFSTLPDPTTKSILEIEIETTTPLDVAFFDCPKPNCPTDGQPVCDSAGNLHG